MRLTVYSDGSMVVTIPHAFREIDSEKFIRAKKEWLFSKIDSFKQLQEKPIARYRYEDYLRYKGSALALAKDKAAYFSQAYGYRYHNIRIKNQKTCWGSCSKKGNLNFNYKILFLPEHIQNYIVAHELCHLKELNHSKKFWELVARMIPDYSDIKSELKKRGVSFQ